MRRKPGFWYLMLVLMMSLLLLLSCRQDAPTAEPTPLPPSESTETAWAPELLTRQRHEEKIHSVAFAPDGSLIAAGLSTEARLWSVTGEGEADTIEYRHTVEDLAFSPNGTLLGGGQGLWGVRLVQVADGSELHQLGSGYNNRLAFSPAGETVATGNRGGIVSLWRVQDGELLAEWEAPETAWVAALAFSPDGQILAAGHWGGEVHLWQVTDGRLLHTLPPQTDFCEVEGLAFTADGQRLAVAGARHELDHVIRLWTVADGSIHQDLSLSSETNAVAISPDGQLLAAGTREGVTLWQMPEGALLQALERGSEDGAESDWVTDVAFSPDGRMLVVGWWNGLLELWQIEP